MQLFFLHSDLGSKSALRAVDFILYNQNTKLILGTIIRTEHDKVRVAVVDDDRLYRDEIIKLLA